MEVISACPSSVSYFIHEDEMPGYTETKILFIKIYSRSRACWNLPEEAPHPKKIQNLNNRWN